MLGFSLSKTKFLVLSGEIRSVKDGHHRRILPEWVDDYIRRRVEEHVGVTRKRARGNGEGSIFPYRTGYAAYAWVITPEGYASVSGFTARHEMK